MKCEPFPQRHFSQKLSRAFRLFRAKVVRNLLQLLCAMVDPMSKCAAAAVDCCVWYRSTAPRPVVVTTAAVQPVRLVSNCQFRPRDRHRWIGSAAPPLCAERDGGSACAVPLRPRLGRPSSDPSQGGWSCPIGSIFRPEEALHSPASALGGEEMRADFPRRLRSANGGGRCA